MEVYKKHLVRARLNSTQRQQLERPPQLKGSAYREIRSRKRHPTRSTKKGEIDGQTSYRWLVYRFVLCAEQLVDVHPSPNSDQRDSPAITRRLRFH